MPPWTDDSPSAGWLLCPAVLSSLLSWSLCSALSFFLHLVSLCSSHPIFLHSLHSSPLRSLSLISLGASFWPLCLSSILFLCPYCSSWKTILCPEYIWFDLEPLPHSSEPSIQPFLLGVPARSPGLFTVPCTPSSRSGLSFLLTDGRAVSSPSLKQHLIAVFCSWTSKLGLRRCAGSQCAVSEGEEVSE